MTQPPIIVWASRPIPDPWGQPLNEHHLVVGTIDDVPTDVTAVVAAARPDFDEAFIAAHPSLRVIARTGTGFDNVDVEAATRHGVVVCTNPGGGAILATAEHALALMFAASKKLEFCRDMIRRGERDPFSRYISKQLSGGAVGVVGYGRIGSEFARLANGIGMRVYAFDPHVADTPGAERVDDLSEMLGLVDVVSLHLPLTEESIGLVDEEFLAAMRPGSILVNTSKGRLIDEDALAESLDAGHVFAAGLDAAAIEPMTSEAPLWDRTDVVLSPQVGASTHEAKESLWTTVVGQILAVADGVVPDGALNPEALRR